MMVTKKIRPQEGQQLKSSDVSNISHALEQTMNDGVLSGVTNQSNGFIFGNLGLKVVPSSGLDVQISAGLGVVFDASESSTFRAQHKFVNVESADTQTIASNSSGFTRIDLISITFNVDQDDQSEDRVFRTSATGQLVTQAAVYSTKDEYTIVYTQGTAGLGVAPDVPEDNIPLAEITVIDSAAVINAADIKDRRPIYHLEEDASKLVVADNQASVRADYYGAEGIQDAINALPSDGGEVLIRTGTYDLDEVIKLRDNVKLTGQGSGTILRNSLRDAIRIGKDDLSSSPVSLVNFSANTNMAVAYNSHNHEFGVVAVEPDPHLPTVNFYVVDAETQEISSAITLDTSAIVGNRVDIAFNSDQKEYGVVWEDANHAIQVARVSQGGVELIQEQVDTAANNCSNPAISYNSEAASVGYGIVWNDDSTDEVLYRKFFTSFSSIVTVATPGSTPTNPNCDIAYEGNGEFRVVFIDNDGSDDSVKAQRIDASANGLVGSVATVHANGSEDHIGCRVESGDGAAGVVWFDDTNDIIKFRALDSSADTFVAAAVDLDTLAAESVTPEIVFDAINITFKIAWTDGTTPNGEIHVGGRDKDGTQSLADTTIDNSIIGDQYIAIAFDLIAERAVLFWADDTDLTMEVRSPASMATEVVGCHIQNLAIDNSSTAVGTEGQIDVRNAAKVIITGCSFTGTGNGDGVTIDALTDATVIVANVFDTFSTEVVNNGTNTVDTGNAKI